MSAMAGIHFPNNLARRQQKAAPQHLLLFGVGLKQLL
jgi:hypothetical protein